MSEISLQIETQVKRIWDDHTQYMAKISSGPGRIDFELYFYTHHHKGVKSSEYSLNDNYYYSYKDLEEAMKRDWLDNHGPKGTKGRKNKPQKLSREQIQRNDKMLCFCLMPIIFPVLIAIAFLGLSLDIALFLLTFGYCCFKCHNYSFKRDSFFLKGINYAKDSFMQNCCCCCLNRGEVIQPELSSHKLKGRK